MGNPAMRVLFCSSRMRTALVRPVTGTYRRPSPVWVPDPPAPTGIGDTRPPVNMPVRDLLANEKLQTGLMGVSVVRTDLQQQVDQQAGQFTADDRATLQQIFQLVSKL